MKNNTSYIAQKKDKKQRVMFVTGLVAIIIGVSVLGFYGIRKVCREYHKQKLMRENPVVEIAALNIKAPILEGTDKKTISKAVGHFIGTGDLGKGNYCIAGHSSSIYKEYLNGLKNVCVGMKIILYDKQKSSWVYTVKESFIVDSEGTWILNDFGDNRITVITCTDDGKQRHVVIGILN